jgi:hypothetical protein
MDLLILALKKRLSASPEEDFVQAVSQNFVFLE